MKPLVVPSYEPAKSPVSARGRRSALIFLAEFLALSIVWIFISDLALQGMHLPSGVLATISIAKGFTYVGVVGWAIWKARLSVSGYIEHAQRREEAADFEVLHRLARTAEFRDEASGFHNQRIGLFAEVLGRRLGMSSDACRTLRFAAMLHDVGKISVPDAILQKPGPLTPCERQIIERHVAVGHDILANSSWSGIEVARKIARHHHENWDGSGYPDGLATWSIPTEARIVAVCDVFDALLSERPYKPAWTWDEAVAEIRSLCGAKFDPAVVEAFCGETATLKKIRSRLAG